MNNYITLDSYKYPTIAEAWGEVIQRPASADMLLDGTYAVTFGPAAFKKWQGFIKADVTARDTGWGTIATLRATLAKLSTLSYTDHYGNAYTVLVSIKGPEQSLSPMWDAATNEFTVPVEIIQVA